MKQKFLEIIEGNGNRCYIPMSNINRLWILGNDVEIDGKPGAHCPNVSNIDAIVSRMNAEIIYPSEYPAQEVSTE